MLRVDEIHQLGERVFFGKHSETLAEQLLGENREFDSDRSHLQTATGTHQTLTPFNKRVAHTRTVVKQHQQYFEQLCPCDPTTGGTLLDTNGVAFANSASSGPNADGSFPIDDTISFNLGAAPLIKFSAF